MNTTFKSKCRIPVLLACVSMLVSLIRSVAGLVEMFMGYMALTE